MGAGVGWGCGGRTGLGGRGGVGWLGWAGWLAVLGWAGPGRAGQNMKNYENNMTNICFPVNIYLKENPTRDVIILSHVKEILELDYVAVKKYTNRPMALYSSMLNCKEIAKITVVGI